MKYRSGEYIGGRFVLRFCFLAKLLHHAKTSVAICQRESNVLESVKGVFPLKGVDLSTRERNYWKISEGKKSNLHGFEISDIVYDKFE